MSLRGGTTKQSFQKRYYVYIFTSFTNSVIYTGITNDLVRRVYEHKEKLIDGFTKKFNVNKLVYYEECFDVKSAIEREKQVKAGSRKKKMEIASTINPGFKDLYPDLIQ